MAKLADRLQFEVRWLPFMLNPDAPVEGLNKLDYYNRKFGTARTSQIVPMMTRTFAEEGLSYSIGGMTGNTMDSHRLLTWAESQFGAAKQNELVEELFKNYFCEEKYIGDRAVLVAAANKVGLPGAAAFLADPQNGLAEVRALLGRAKGVNGVPFFIVDNKYRVSGGQAPEYFERIFEEILDEGK